MHKKFLRTLVFILGIPVLICGIKTAGAMDNDPKEIEDSLYISPSAHNPLSTAEEKAVTDEAPPRGPKKFTRLTREEYLEKHPGHWITEEQYNQTPPNCDAFNACPRCDPRHLRREDALYHPCDWTYSQPNNPTCFITTPCPCCQQPLECCCEIMGVFCSIQ